MKGEHPRPVRNLGDDRNVAGMPALASMFGVIEKTVRRWATIGARKRPRGVKAFDPLRLRVHPGRCDNFPVGRRERCIAWYTRTYGSDEQRATLPVAYGWANIAAMCDTNEPSARRLAARTRDPLPVQPKRRLNPETGTYEVWAYVDALRDWLEAHAVPYVAGGGPTTRDDVCPPLGARHDRDRSSRVRKVAKHAA